MARDESELPRMTLPEHLRELRSRVLRSCLALLVTMIACLWFIDELWAFTVAPFSEALAAVGVQPHGLQSLEPGEAFLGSFRLCFLVSMIVSAPVILWQMWGFIAAGLYENERRAVRVFFPVSVVLFGLGIMMAFLVLIPFGLRFLIGWDQQLGFPSNYSVSRYLSTCVRMVMAMGFLFELPLLMLFLQAANIVPRKTWMAGWRWAVLLAFVLGMLFTDPSPVTQVMMAIPIIGLYMLGVWGGRFVGEGAQRFTPLKAWPLVLAALTYALLILYREPINAWSMRLTGVGAGAAAPAAPAAAPDPDPPAIDSPATPPPPTDE